MQTKRIWQVDAFAGTVYRGNPCAVIFDAGDIPAERMQAIAQEMNLSETVFLCPPTVPDADYRARIFTPVNELPFAGHPTLSAAWSVHRSLAEAGFGPLPTVLRQECGAGIVPVEVTEQDGRTLFTMTQNAPKFIPLDIDHARVASILGCAVADIEGPALDAVNTGIPWMFTRLKTPAQVAALKPDMTGIMGLSAETGIVGMGVWSVGALAVGCDVKLRCFAPAGAAPEDPVTGSANGCLAALIARDAVLGAAPFRYRAEQGTEMGRDGRVEVEVLAGEIRPRVGGEVVRVMTGELVV